MGASALRREAHVRARSRRRPRGQALVEFALITPLFLLLLSGLVDFGMGLYSYMTIINGARDGARVAASTCGSVASCSTAVANRVSSASGGLHPTVAVLCSTSAAPGTATTAICDSGAAKNGGKVVVTASYSYRMIWPLAFGNQIQMTSSATFLVQ